MQSLPAAAVEKSMNGHAKRLNPTADGLRAMATHENLLWGFVRHGQKQHLQGKVYTNTVQGLWSIVERNFVEMFHEVSAKHPPLCFSEFGLQYKHRKNADIFGAAIQGC
jgi:hypothetical protein